MAKDAIGEAFRQMLQALVALEQALAAESEALSAAVHDPAVIASATQRKQTLVMEINGLVRDVDGHLAAQGLAPGREGVQSWLAALPADDGLRGVWQSILDLGQRCKDMNETNGLQIGLLSRRTQEALKILLGGDSVGDTYGPDGGGRVASASRTFYTA